MDNETNAITGPILSSQNPTKRKIFLERYGKLIFVYSILASIIPLVIILIASLIILFMAIFIVFPQILFVISSVILAKKGRKLSKYLLKPDEVNKTINVIITITVIHLVIMIFSLSTYILEIIFNPPGSSFLWTLTLIMIVSSAILLILEILIIVFGAIFKKKY